MNSENEKIKLTKDELKSDIGFLEQHYVIMLSLVLTIVLYRSVFDDAQRNPSDSDERIKAEQLIQDMITKLL